MATAEVAERLSSAVVSIRSAGRDWTWLVPRLLTALAFLVLFWAPLTTLGRDWWQDPEAAHGLLLAPLALVLVWRRGISPLARPQPVLGLALLVFAILLRYGSHLAAELFTMRLSLFLALAALVISAWGVRQVLHWWLPVGLLLLSIPVPAVLLGSLALPLQLEASQMGAALLEWRNVPVLLSGNVIHLPGQTLFVTEACSGLRSLTALLALGLLIGGIWLRMPILRVLLIALAIPVAMVLNGLRVFLTGFLVYYMGPAWGEGVMHYSEGWAFFVVAFVILGVMAWAFSGLERLLPRLRLRKASP
ncbi:MAG: exosortase/archaeosortase family protein [Longimicrobiales bacterium]